ncbi:MAG: uracil phosphoribosyltransferase [Ignavibacteria bacterium CG2_30_36_16]|nr:uracil phosphoribosyltransferase [Ignavibacteria bacterium]OIP55530.1 MAG: uracil phosphoribosyltransferase [Ignavibacteria bacterium CG2_30_36_16]PJB00464.1 MAG: uracil phosphoribosyltransferase [Ignavibacteria bacterium CG_4_9_14_3_um_filter_36_18]
MQHDLRNFVIIDNPLIKRDVTLLRDKHTQPEQFRAVVKRISSVLAVEIAKDFELEEIEVDTPLETTAGFELKQQVVLVPVLRAGLGMVAGFLELMPYARVGHIGLQRDEETLLPIEYYYKTPRNIENAEVILLDPMLATGGSGSEAIKFLKKRGAKNIVFACLVAAPEGVQKILAEHPDVRIYGAALDRELNSKGYILPGLGDAGDRTFGTL